MIFYFFIVFKVLNCLSNFLKFFFNLFLIYGYILRAYVFLIARKTRKGKFGLNKIIYNYLSRYLS